MSTVRIYDNGGITFDRYTAVYMDQPENGVGMLSARGMSERPNHPQGFGQMTSAMAGLHLGKRIKLTDLPEACQKLVLSDLDMGARLPSPEDYGLDDDALELKYSPTGDGEHPKITRDDWKQEVENDGTSSGYWSWLAREIEHERDDEDMSAVIDAGVSDPDDADEPEETAAVDAPRG
jgi:hypothetical protein